MHLYFKKIIKQVYKYAYDNIVAYVQLEFATRLYDTSMSRY